MWLNFVAQLSTFDRAERTGERTGEQCRRAPECELRRRFPRFVGRRLCLRDRLIDALLGLLLRKTSAGGNQLSKARAIRRRHLRSIRKTARENARCFTTG